MIEFRNLTLSLHASFYGSNINICQTLNACHDIKDKQNSPYKFNFRKISNDSNYISN